MPRDFASENQSGVLAGRYLKSRASGPDISSQIQFVQRQARWSPRDRAEIVQAIETRSVISPIAFANSPMQPDSLSADYVAVENELSIFGRMQGIVEAPPNTRMIFGASGSSAAFIGEGEAVPVGTIDFDSAGTLGAPPKKCCAIKVVTRELAEASSPASDRILALELAAATAAEIDVVVFDPGNGGGANRPASLTNQGVLISSSGSTAANIASDLRLMLTRAATYRRPYLVSRGATFATLLTLLGSGGSRTFPNTTISSFEGVPVLVSSHAQNLTSPGEGFLTAIDAAEVLLYDGGAIIDASREAALQMDDQPQAGAAQLVNLWQLNAVALKCTRWLDWRLRRQSAAVTLTDIGF